MPSSAPSCLPQRQPSGAYEEGIAGMLTIIKASLLGSALMLLESCSGYLTNYQTPCVEGARLRMRTVHDVEPKLARLSRLRKSQIPPTLIEMCGCDCGLIMPL